VRREIKELKKADGATIRLIYLHYEPKELCEAYKEMPDFECWDSAKQVFIKKEGNDEGLRYPVVVRPHCPEGI